MSEKQSVKKTVKSSVPMKGRDMAAPVKDITIKGIVYPLKFNNYSARLAEDVYEDQYGKDKNYTDILQELSRGKYRAIMAVFFGAMVSGGHSMSWADFDEQFKLDSISGIKEVIAKGIVQALPQADDDEEDPKND